MGVTAAKGFEAAGIACGIKEDGRPDLALVATAGRRPVPAAAVFTTNKVQAAPVQVSRDHLVDGKAVAVVLNSGNANAATGSQGRADAERMCQLAAEGLGCSAGDVLVCSTGLIGIPLPMDPLETGIPKLTGALRADKAGGVQAAEAIMTTDTRPKQAAVALSDGGHTVMIGGMAKGAAMLAPSMATMLAVATTDAAIQPAAMRAMLEHAVDRSFHELLIDGCTSTNDTVILLASGVAGAPEVNASSPSFHAMTEALTDVLADLAQQMATDAEGATKLVRVHVGGARSDEEARRVARHVAGSLLVKCSLYGKDPYWGRVLSELGASGVTLEPDAVSIAYNGVVVCRGGIAAGHDPDAIVAAMEQREIDLSCDLGLGAGTATVLTSDLTHAYVDENMGTS
ncbi:MAG: bifunctional glutamate N-acetyltransferase/amino-acid acetyltransferase ArgJ [Actinobacteria bacterium]|nr:bifunctional glutamate N-acetyltransferase/amino-acid acetyltransferase ArgJ [Actinomycetota bacterium]